MASPFINIYKDNPTAGGTDGTAVSTGDSFASPIQFTLDAEQSESRTMKCAIRTGAGYKAQNVTISDLNDAEDRFKLCKTSSGTFTDEIFFAEVFDTNTIFYVKATSANNEQPKTDRTVKIRYYGTLVAV